MKSNNKDMAFVKKVWVMANDDSRVYKETGSMVGDGRLELVFVSGNGYRTKLGDKISEWSEGIYVGGHIDQSFEMELLPDTTLTFFKIEPWVAGLVSGFDFQKSLNTTIPLKEINKHLYNRLMNNGTLSNSSETLSILNQSFEANLNQFNDFDLMQFTSRYWESNFQEFKKSKKDLLDKLNISSRTLETKFGRSIGLTPLKFVNTIRFRKIMEYIYHTQDKQPMSFTDLSYMFGYYDQAHFIRTCKVFTGLTPTKLSKRKLFFD